MSEILWQLISIFFLSSTKMILGLIWAANADFSLILSFLATYLGGIAGIFFYTLLGFKINAWYLKHFGRKKNSSLKKRILIRFKNRFGLVGISIFTPLLLSIPLGCLLSFTQTESVRKIISFQIISLSVWLILIFGLKYFLNFRINDLF